MGQEQLDALINKVENYKLPIILALLGIIFIGLGFLVPKFSASKKDIVFQSNTADSSSKVKVDVSGEVNSPGVYSLESNSRVEDAIKAAGGFTSQADGDWVAKQLNLAAKLEDGQKIYVSSRNQGVLGATTQSKISINQGSLEQLDSLPGVGPVTAQKIIAARPYKSTEELLTKKIVGSATYEKIKDQISVF